MGPYIGGGLGFARVSVNDLSILGIPSTDDDDSVFAYQLGAGAAWEIDPNLAVTFDYRWFATQDLEMTNLAGVGFKAEVSSHN